MESKDKINDASAMKKEWREKQGSSQREKQNEWHDHTDTEKYLGMEQPGVKYTDEGHPEYNPDDIETRDQLSDHWKSNGDNSRNAEAFNQDDYILRDNIDLDEDQNESLSNPDADK